jgi:hypothetical protein
MFCHLTVSTLAHHRQKCKRFLAVNRLNVTEDHQNLSFPIQQNQKVALFPFLITKNPLLNPTPARAPTAQATAAGDLPPSEDRGRAVPEAQPICE